MPSKRSPLRRNLAVLSAALLAVAWAVGISIPASAGHVKGSLDIVSVTDVGSGLGGPVQDRPFNVVVRVLDSYGKPTTVRYPTPIVLEEVSGPGDLGGTTTAVIPRNGSGATISGATYSQFANGVVLRVRAEYGAELAPDKVTVEVALTAVGADAYPGKPLKLKDPNCAAPTAEVPSCGQFVLRNGASGHVTLSVGSCDGLGPCAARGDTEALVVTAIANLKNAKGKPLYSNKKPAALILACDKELCPQTSKGKAVRHIRVLYTLNNTGPLEKTAPPCTHKRVLGKGQEACVDYARSKRSRGGDLYLPLLFNVDARASFP